MPVEQVEMEDLIKHMLSSYMGSLLSLTSKKTTAFINLKPDMHLANKTKSWL